MSTPVVQQNTISSTDVPINFLEESTTLIILYLTQMTVKFMSHEGL